MTIEIQSDGTVSLVGACAVEDAEALLQAVLANPGCTVDVARCTHLHTAAFQVLLRARVQIGGSFESGFLRTWIQPILAPPSADEHIQASGKRSGKKARK